MAASPSASGTLHRIGDTAAHAGAGLVVGLGVLAWVVVGSVSGFPDWWQVVLESVSASLTLVMVFTIQHTQARQQAATQRKLDELLRAMPDAHDQLIAVEHAPATELEQLSELNRADRDRARATRTG